MDKLLADAKRHAFMIPRFQREFVWTIGQVKLLIDSIARNYPIGSLLLLAETDPNDPLLKSRRVQATLRPDNELDTAAEENLPNQFYVLDGQQRLTSIVRVFLQASPDEVFYFDLKKLREFGDVTAKTDWLIKRSQTARLPNQYLRSDVIIDRQRCQVLVEEYFESSDDDLRGNRPLQREASARVNSVFETIRNYQIPYVVIDRSESLEGICRIFETINSTGTRLTTFDLAVARFFPEPDLQAVWEESRRDHPTLRNYEVDGERVLQVVAMLDSVAQGTVTEVTRSVLLKLPKPVVKERWGPAVEYLVAAYSWAESRGVARGIFPNEALMVPLAVFFSQADSVWKRRQPGYQSLLDKWYFASCLQQGARQASNYRIAEATVELMRWRTVGTPPNVPKVFLTPDQVLSLRSTDGRYRTIMAFLRWQLGTDLWTEEELDPMTVKHDHHIFPAALAKRHGIPRPLLDSVSNRLLVSAATNQMLGDRLPQDYLVKLIDEARNTSTLRRRLESLRKACIALPADREQMIQALDIANAEAFIRTRAELICDAIEHVLEDAFVRTAGDEEE